MVIYSAGLANDTPLGEQMEDDFPRRDAGKGRALLPLRLPDPEGNAPADEWLMKLPASLGDGRSLPLEDGVEGGGSPSAKKAAAPGTWTTPTSTLEPAFVSPI